ncbi:MAG: BlaI/MecI/CopY family transcriptional regulator [Planctomycetaceae bacterium]|nr:BlaI/MecI/CopY family transcriptional regulator [Planctomycetaceae bacterium]
MPEGSLTASQYEIMEAVWTAGSAGASVSEIWQAIGKNRDVARTTVLNLVDRLEKRGWLKRRDEAGANRFCATVSRKQAESFLAGEFIDAYFGGSAGDLVMSLLGNRQLDSSEIIRLRKLLDEPSSGSAGDHS